MSKKYSTNELIEFIAESKIDVTDDRCFTIIARLRAADGLLSAAKEYVDRMEEIYDNESYKGIWGLAYAHGVKYDGPNDVEARKNIHKTIAEYEGKEEK